MNKKRNKGYQGVRTVGLFLLIVTVCLGVTPFTWWIGCICSLGGIFIMIYGRNSNEMKLIGRILLLIGVLTSLIGGGIYLYLMSLVCESVSR